MNRRLLPLLLLAATAHDVDPPEGVERVPPSAPPPPDLSDEPAPGEISRGTLEVVCTSTACGYKPCTGPGVWVPVLLLRSLKSGTASPARLELPVAVCDRHRGGLDDYLSEKGWTEMVGGQFKAAGLPKPARHLTVVEHLRIPGR